MEQLFSNELEAYLKSYGISLDDVSEIIVDIAGSANRDRPVMWRVTSYAKLMVDHGPRFYVNTVDDVAKNIMWIPAPPIQ